MKLERWVYDLMFQYFRKLDEKKPSIKEPLF